MKTFWGAATLAAMGIYLLLTWLYRPFVADDAYIVGRYAMNAANGLGLVYNEGEYVSALTSPLHALLVTGFALLSDNPVDIYRIIAPVFPVASWGLAILIYRPAPREIAVVSAFALASPFLALWAGGGLETPILAALITLFAAFLLRISRRGRFDLPETLGLAVLAGLAFLTRFDSILVTLPPMLALAVIGWKRLYLWAAAAVSLAIAASWLVFAWVYYGDILPTSVYVKMSARSLQPLDSIASTTNIVLVSGLLMLLIFGAVGGRTETKRSRPAQAIRFGATASLFLFLIYAVNSSGVHMMFGYRMFVPYLFAAAMVLAASLPRRLSMIYIPAQLAIHGVVAATVMTVGMNVHVLRDFGSLGSWTAEYKDWTPGTYGAWMASLRADAEDLRTHWAGLDGSRAARIYLNTGGLGYFLPDFYVFEVLASYRHDCYAGTRGAMRASDYVQNLDVGDWVLNVHGMDRDIADVVILSDDLGPAEGRYDWTINYLYAPALDDLRLPSRLADPCPFESLTF